jgi:HlyD family secretion protein
MKKLWTLLLVLLAAGTAIGLYVRNSHEQTAPDVSQGVVTRADIVQSTTATGTLQATRTVQIGTQISGTVLKMYADFNSIVHKGELIAELDPSILQAQLNSDEASVEDAQIILSQDQLTLDIDQKNFKRSEDLFSHDLESAQDRDTARLQVANDQAKIKDDQSNIETATVRVKQDRIDLAYCEIYSPIDGVVIERDVDEGQTVAARISAPTFYTLATNLEELELMAQVDEADVSRIRPGQAVAFTVESYPQRMFGGKVESVRLNATTNNNVVTYDVVIAVPNPDLRLLPGMTANLSVQIWRADNVLAVPNEALKFRPTRAVFEAFGQVSPGTVRLADLAGRGTPTVVPAVRPTNITAATTIDGMFALEPPPNADAEVWFIDDQHHLRSVPVKVGLTNGVVTQVLSGDIALGERLVTKITLSGPAGGPTSGNPLMPGRFGGRGGFGGGPPGGFRGGGF